jgi:site-specific DNA recombinase
MTTNIYYAAYLRDSGGEEQELSIVQQEKEIRVWCQQQGYILTKVFKDEARPGSTAVTREAFQEMMRHFRSGDCQERGVIIWKFSRFARDIDDAQFYKADLRRRGYEIISMKDTVPEGLDGRFFEAAIDWMNARFLDDLSTDVKRGIRHILENYGGLPGTPPKGFKREPITVGTHRGGKPHIVHKWVPDPELWDLCRLAWDMRARGASFSQIRDATGLYRSITSYSSFFRNRLYLGELNYGEITIPDYAPALIDEDTWNAVQLLNRRRSKLNDPNGSSITHPRRSKSSFMLSGIARCARCGSPLNGKVVQFKTGQKHPYHYYECSRQQRRKDCGAPKIPRDALEEVVLEKVKNYILTAENVTSVLKRVEQVDDGRVNARLKALKQELTTTRRKLSNLMDLITESGSKRLLVRLKELENHESELLFEISKLDLSDKNIPAEEIIELNQILVQCLEVGDTQGRRSILSGFIDKIVAERANNMVLGSIRYHIPVPIKKKTPESGVDGALCVSSVLPWRHLNSAKWRSFCINIFVSKRKAGAPIRG